MKYTFIKANRNNYPITLLCKVMDVSRRGFYNWLERPLSNRDKKNRLLKEVIIRVFYENRCVYGAPRIHQSLLAQGYKCSLNRVARLMREASIVPKTVRRFRITTDSRKSLKPANNLLNRQFSQPTKNLAWAADVTYIPTRQGWLYLAVVLDLYSRRVIGWSMSDRLDSMLSKQALVNAIEQREIQDGIVLHSDRGKEYYAKEYQSLLRLYNMVCSMSRKGDCYDNAVVESFFHSLKVELVHHNDYHTRREAKSSIFEYIELFYNRQRIHSYLNYLSPVEFEERAVA